MKKFLFIMLIIFAGASLRVLADIVKPPGCGPGPGPGHCACYGDFVAGKYQIGTLYCAHRAPSPLGTGCLLTGDCHHLEPKDYPNEYDGWYEAIDGGS